LRELELAGFDGDVNLGAADDERRGHIVREDQNASKYKKAWAEEKFGDSEREHFVDHRSMGSIPGSAGFIRH
jgi:hypothetical protein